MGRARAVGLFLVVAAGTAGTAAASAEPFDVKLGLWEVTNTTQTRGTPPIDTSRLTPEQRQRLEAALQANQGTRTRTFRSCLTKEKLDKELFPEKEENASCTHTVLSSTRTVRDVKLECTGEQHVTGHVRFEALSRERVKGTSEVTVGEGARSMNVDSTIAGRWIGSDCGSVR